MAVANRLPEPPSAEGGVWLSPEHLERITPLMRLLTTISGLPEVSKISVTATNVSIDLWVFMPKENHAAEARISLAERDFLLAQPLPGFMLTVIPGEDVSSDVLPLNTVLFER